MLHASCLMLPSTSRERPGYTAGGETPGCPPPTSRRALSALASPWRAANAPLAASGRFPPSFPSKGSQSLILCCLLPRWHLGVCICLQGRFGTLEGVSEGGGGGSALGGRRQAGRMVTLATLVARCGVG